MGIPYSKEINAAFEQVTPLVAAGFEVLNTTKNIAVALFIIQIITVVLLALILLALVGLLFSLNPDLEHERQMFVTPTMKWLASWSQTREGAPKSVAGVVVMLFALAGFGFLGYVYYKRKVEDAVVESEPAVQPDEKAPKGKDVDNVKKGESKQ